MANNPELILHWFPGTCARVTLIALEELGLPFETRLLRRFEPEAIAAYKRDVNPKGKVPALVIDGRLQTENVAIQVFLNGRFPEAKLLPEDPDTYLEALTMMTWFSSALHPLVGRSRFPEKFSDESGDHEGIRRVAVAQLRDAFTLIEAHLADREWMFDDRWTAVDGYMLWCWFRSVGSGLKVEEFPKVDEVARRIEQRPSVSRALDREVEAFAELEREGKMPPQPPLPGGYLP
jgi:glutathione S-transferase